MEKLQFNSDMNSLYSPTSPDVVDISRESENSFSMDPGNIAQLDERFRINTTGSNLMSALMGSTLASLYVDLANTAERNESVSATGTQIEQDLMELLGEPQEDTMISPSSFVDSEFEEGNLFPWTLGNTPPEDTNNYGWPTARVPPTQRVNPSAGGILPRPTPTYPPNYRPETSDFQHTQLSEPMEQELRRDIAPSQGTLGAVQGFNLSPAFFPIPMRGAPIENQQITVQPMVQLGFLFHVTHSTNIMMIPARERQSMRLLPTVMSNVAGYCDICGKCYDQIALETLGEYLMATEYEGETVKERAVRSRAFIHGFEAAQFLFKNAGLSHPSRCDGSVVQL